MSDDLASLRKQMQQLASLHAAGTLDDAAYQEARARLERRMVDAVMNDSVAAQAPAAPAAPATARAPAKLLGGLALLVLLIAVAGYWGLGGGGLGGGGLGGRTGADGQVADDTNPAAAEAGASAAGGSPHAMNFGQIAAMADKLAQRLKDQPGDAEGWAMLARSYTVLGRNPEAVAAYQKAVELRADDASLLADYADALAVKNDRRLEGEPAKLLERALKLEPNNPKALSLAGTAAFDRKDYAAAARHWERVVQAGPADSPLVQQVQASLAEARELGKLPTPAGSTVPTLPSSPASSAAPLATPAAAKSSAQATVSGTVTLASSLASQASPSDTVFIFARAVGGAPMPLAVLRKQVRDLPITYTLDDSLAMAPTAKLSGARQVVVSARVSRSGDAIPQAGDLSGQSAPVAVGAGGVGIVIDTVVKK